MKYQNLDFTVKCLLPFFIIIPCHEMWLVPFLLFFFIQRIAIQGAIHGDWVEMEAINERNVVVVFLLFHACYAGGHI